MGKGSAPEQDPRIAEAALLSAETGQQYLSFMQDQAEITNQWAEDDRARYIDVFQPLQDEFIADAASYDTPERQAAAVNAATADVRMQAGLAQGQADRRLASMGVDPTSGRSIETMRRAETDEGLAAAGAANGARLQVEETGRAMEAAAINMGNGLAVNPATSIGLTNSAGASGYQGAIQAQGQSAQILNTDYQNRYNAWQDEMGAWGGLAGAAGQLLGASGLLMSSKDYKENKSPSKGNLEAVRKMPVENWKYKEGIADGKEHVGTYAEDFKAATGKGDGRSIPMVDAIGVTMGAVKEMDAKISRIERALM